jgi:putative hydrolase of the HAD superfamily
VSPARPRTRWVFFDAGGTLFDTLLSPDRIVRALGDLAPDRPPRGYRDLLARAQREALAADHLGPAPDWPVDAGRARRRWSRLLDRLIAALGLSGAAGQAARDRLWQALAGPQCFPLFEDARPALERLAGLGYRLAVVSNWEPRLEQLCAAHGLAGLLEFVLASEAVGFAKPSRRIFARALELAAVAPNQAVQVGDSLELDARAAQAVGLAAVLLDRGGYYPPASWNPTIASLAALPDLLAAAD